jgi:hypothetical protein
MCLNLAFLSALVPSFSANRSGERVDPNLIQNDILSARISCRNVATIMTYSLFSSCHDRHPVGTPLSNTSHLT